MTITTYTSKRGTRYSISPSTVYSAAFDWGAEDYDGAPDSKDNRCGWGAPSIEAAVEDIEETEDFGNYL